MVFDYQWLYGLTKRMYRILLGSQFGVCALCGAAFSSRHGESPVVDHDHSLGHNRADAVRGIVHKRCNTRISTVERGVSRHGQWLDDLVHAYLCRPYPFAKGVKR